MWITFLVASVLMIKIVALPTNNREKNIYNHRERIENSDEDCNVFDLNDVQRFDPEKCLTVTVTGITPDGSGHLVYNGLTKNETIGTYRPLILK